MDKTNLVSVAICCNEPTNGTFTGYFDCVDIGDNVIRLVPEYADWKGLSVHLNFSMEQPGGFGADKVTGHVKIARRAFPVYGYKYGWGNWCWDMVLMQPEDVVDLLNYLKSFKDFHAEDTIDLFQEIWESPDREFAKGESPEMKILTEEGYQRP